MAKKKCKITFISEVESPVGSGVWRPQKTERYYKADIINNVRGLTPGEGTNNNVTVSNRFSIVGDPYANANFSAMRSIYWMGAEWEIKSVSIEYPRLILEIGGVWNG